MSTSGADDQHETPPTGDNPNGERQTPVGAADPRAPQDITIALAKMQEMVNALQKKTDEQDALHSTLTTELETMRTDAQERSRQEDLVGGAARRNGIEPVALTFTTPAAGAEGRIPPANGATDPPPVNRPELNANGGNRAAGGTQGPPTHRPVPAATKHSQKSWIDSWRRRSANSSSKDPSIREENIMTHEEKDKTS